MRFISMTSFAIAESVKDRLSMKINVRTLQPCTGQLKGTLKLRDFGRNRLFIGTRLAKSSSNDWVARFKLPFSLPR